MNTKHDFLTMITNYELLIIALTIAKDLFYTMCHTKMVVELDHFSTEYLFLKWWFRTEIHDHLSTGKA